MKIPLHSAGYELGRINNIIVRKHDLDHVVFEEVIERRNEDMGQSIDGRIRSRMERDYREELAKTCGSQLASSYQMRMSYALNGIPLVCNRIYGMVLGMASLSAHLTEEFSPFLASFVLEVMGMCRRLGIQRLVVFSRDGDVFYVIAKVLQENLFHELEVKLEPINRRLFQIEDKPIGMDGKDYSQLIKEVGARVLQDKGLLEYLNRVFGDGNEVAILDSGVYGSIAGVIDYLHQIGAIKPKPFVFFFASRNPYIYGFVNRHLEKIPVSETQWPCWLELFADTIEVLAKTHGSVTPSSTDNRLRFPAKPIKSSLYEASSWGLLVAVRDYALYKLPEELDKMRRPDLLIKDLYLSYREAMEGRVISTLFLENHALPSPYGPAILSGWSRGILPPLDLLLGYSHPRMYRVVSECTCNRRTQK